jgi:hypothetical protein
LASSNARNPRVLASSSRFHSAMVPLTAQSRKVAVILLNFSINSPGVWL